MGIPATDRARNWTPLKGAVLGLLVAGPSHGYELANRLQRQLGPCWMINRKSVYRMLRALEVEGLVYSEPSDQKRSDHSIVFHPTPQAEPAWERWLECTPPLQEAREQLQAKMVVARAEDLPRLLVALDHYERDLFAREAEIRAGLPPRQSLRAAMMYLVRDASIQQIRADLIWAGTSRQMILDLLAS
jgi:DNA-binding PadR family transcriptional regulator